MKIKKLFMHLGAGDNAADLGEGNEGYDGNRQQHRAQRGDSFSYRRGGRGQYRRGRGGRGGYNNQRYQQEDPEEIVGDGAVGVRNKLIFFCPTLIICVWAAMEWCWSWAGQRWWEAI